MYLAFDTETGGFAPEKASLLTGSFFVLDDNFEIVDELGFKLKHEHYLVSAGALEVNKINLIEHDAVAEQRHVIEAKVTAFLAKHANKFNPLKPFGHNVAFDVNFVTKGLPGVNWPAYISHRTVDTMTATAILQDWGILPKSLRGSLGSLTEFFGIQYKAHDAREDILATIQVYRSMKGMVKQSNPCAELLDGAKIIN